MPTRIDEALKAIVLRFCGPGRIKYAELDALAYTQDGLVTLKAERGDGPIRKLRS